MGGWEGRREWQLDYGGGGDGRGWDDAVHFDGIGVESTPAVVVEKFVRKKGSGNIQ